MSEVLSSWKDVAAHLGKSVRTVQRWEAELGLPIHRPNGRQQRIILAYPEELKDWIKAKWGGANAAPEAPPKGRLEQNTTRLAAQMEKLQLLSNTLQQRTAATKNRIEHMRNLAQRNAF